MGLLSTHFQERAIERFGHAMTEDEAEDHWAKGYPVRDAHYLALSMKQHPRRVYRIIIMDHRAAIIARSCDTNFFVTIF